jgi:hypothetical protein
LHGEVALYNLISDIGQQKNVADMHPELVAEGVSYMEQAHIPHGNWSPQGVPPKN